MTEEERRAQRGTEIGPDGVERSKLDGTRWSSADCASEATLELLRYRFLQNKVRSGEATDEEREEAKRLATELQPIRERVLAAQRADS